MCQRIVIVLPLCVLAGCERRVLSQSHGLNLLEALLSHGVWHHTPLPRPMIKRLQAHSYVNETSEHWFKVELNSPLPNDFEQSLRSCLAADVIDKHKAEMIVQTVNQIEGTVGITTAPNGWNPNEMPGAKHILHIQELNWAVDGAPTGGFDFIYDTTRTRLFIHKWNV